MPAVKTPIKQLYNSPYPQPKPKRYGAVFLLAILGGAIWFAYKARSTAAEKGAGIPALPRAESVSSAPESAAKPAPSSAAAKSVPADDTTTTFYPNGTVVITQGGKTTTYGDPPPKEPMTCSDYENSWRAISDEMNNESKLGRYNEAKQKANRLIDALGSIPDACKTERRDAFLVVAIVTKINSEINLGQCRYAYEDLRLLLPFRQSAELQALTDNVAAEYRRRCS